MYSTGKYKQPYCIQDQEQDSSSVWNSLDRLKSELRRMELRLDSAGDVGNIFSSDSTDHCHLPPHHHLVTAASSFSRDVPAVISSSRQKSEDTKYHRASASLPGVHCKISRKVDRTSNDNASKRLQQTDSNHNLTSKPLRQESRQPMHLNHDHGEIKLENPAQAKISKARKLREVNREDTYVDNLTCPTNSGGSNNSATINSTITNSCYIRETDIHFLNFSCVPDTVESTLITTPSSAITSTTDAQDFTSPLCAPAPTVLNRNSIISPSLVSILTSKQTEQPELKWRHHDRVSIKSPTRIVTTDSQKCNVPKLTQVEVKVLGSSKAGHTATSKTPQSNKHKELLDIKAQVEEKWAHMSQRGLHSKHSKHHRHTHRKSEMDVFKNRDTRIEVGTEEIMRDNCLDQPKSPLPFKLFVPAEPKEDKILLRLKEKLERQRTIVTPLTSGNNDPS